MPRGMHIDLYLTVLEDRDAISEALIDLQLQLHQEPNLKTYGLIRRRGQVVGRWWSNENEQAH